MSANPPRSAERRRNPRTHPPQPSASSERAAEGEEERDRNVLDTLRWKGSSTLKGLSAGLQVARAEKLRSGVVLL